MTDKLIKTENVHKVSKRQWKKWTEAGRLVFNDLYETSVANQHLFIHPKATLVSNANWDTIAWNHAWLAADYVSMREKGTVKI